MPMDGFVQLAPDSSGKQVDMEQVATAAGTALYRQRAVIVGEPGDLLQQLFVISLQQLAVSRAMLAIMRADHPGALGEEDFSQDLTPNEY